MANGKRSRTAGATVTTDTDALIDIVAWSRDRPAWLRQALRILVNSKEPTQSQLAELFEMAKPGSAPSAPITEEDVRASGAKQAEVTLKSVGNPQDVNALAPDQKLTFEKSGLTVVYGDNGAGKSGYARILKHACRARIDPKAKAPSILPNVDTQSPGTPRAELTYTVAGQNKQFDWQLDRPSPAELSAISVFDARTASIHVDGTNEVAYVPFSLDLLQRLAKAAEILRERARAAKSALEAQTPHTLKSPPINPQTSVAKAITTLSHTTDLKALEQLSQLTQEEQSTLADLKRDLTSDPTAAARQLVANRDGVNRFAASIEQLCQAASQKTRDDIERLRTRSFQTRAAADAAARHQFSSEPLRLVGSEAWRSMWEAARRYATMDARPEALFPPTTTSDRCPLCQQTLSAEAADRFARFEAFVRDDTKQQADLAARELREALDRVRAVALPISQLTRQLRYLRDNLGDQVTFEAVRSVALKARWQIRCILDEGREAKTVCQEVDPTPATQALTDLARRLSERAATLSAATNSPQRVALQSQLDELEARVWLAGQLPDIKAEVARRLEIVSLDRIIAEADTGVITRKASQLAELLVTDALRAQFSKEIAALGVGNLAVELKKELSQSGAARFRVRLVRKPQQEVGAVLSEGEHRCVALAAFLAELATAGGKSAIIFDDPVSSLDHRHRDDVAKRLAAEALTRQVVVFTHDVAFLMLLNHAAQVAQAHIGYRCIARGVDLAGYCTHEPPFNARPVADVLSAIEANINNRKVLFERGRQAEWRNTVRSSLEQLRECWERAVEEFVGPVLKRLANKVSTAQLIKLTCLEIADCDEMRAGHGRCSELLHSVGESLNPKLPKPGEILDEIAKLRHWHTDIQARQSKIKAA
jgi:energy-coupling factor transporter ATP-binding protein EcfA2